MRLIHAAAELAGEQPPQPLSPERVAALAGVSPAAFAREFDSVEACLRAGAEAALVRATTQARRAAGGDPAARPRDALDGLLEFAEQQTELAGLCVLYAGGASGRAQLALPASLVPALAVALRVLTAIEERPGLHPQRLAGRAGLGSEARSARLIGRLVRFGLIEDDPQHLVLSKRGRDVLATCSGHS
jgi:AcrR family transcriptional regulator